LSLDGSGDYLTLDGHADFNFGTGDFTVEFWINFASVSGAQHIIDWRPATTLGPQITLFKDSAHKFSLYANGALRLYRAALRLAAEGRKEADARD
jgi:hypothetical protein